MQIFDFKIFDLCGRKYAAFNSISLEKYTSIEIPCIKIFRFLFSSANVLFGKRVFSSLQKLPLRTEFTLQKTSKTNKTSTTFKNEGRTVFLCGNQLSSKELISE